MINQHCGVHNITFDRDIGCPTCNINPERFNEIVHIGDVVHLLCGGADMVVSEITKDSNKTIFVTCEWHDSNLSPVCRTYDVKLMKKGNR